MALASYTKGQQVRFTGTFKNEAGALADPTTVTFRLKAPDGTLTTPTASSTSTGVWTALATLTQEGTYHFRFEGAGAIVAANEDAVVVTRSQF